MASTAYWYRVSAVNAGGDSFPSNEVRIVTAISAPQISLVMPAIPTVSSGGALTIEADAVAPGSTVSSVEYQIVMDNPLGTFNAKDIYAYPDGSHHPGGSRGVPG